jgi:hypothetical protein
MNLANIPDLPPVGTVITARTSHVASIELMRNRYAEIFGHCSDADMFALRHLLREAWKSPDLRHREWFVFLLRRFYAEIMRRVEALQRDAGENLVRGWRNKKDTLDYIFEKSEKPFPVPEMLFNLMDSEQHAAALKDGPPSLNGFERCAVYLQRNLHRARYCAGPECAAPYFFILRKGQRYCSTDCLLPVQRESKRRWWKANRAKSKRR